MKNKSKTFEIGIKGEKALFTNPIFKTSGEKASYHVPTYGGLKGLVENIYWKPTFVINIESLRIMNEIRHVANLYAISSMKQKNKKDLFHYSYLNNVFYKVKFHFTWNLGSKRNDLTEDRVWEKHEEIMTRKIKQGGKRAPFLGVSECPAAVFFSDFDSDEGFYDNSGTMDFGFMFHSFLWGGEYDSNVLRKSFWRCEMKNGIISFPKPDDTAHIETVRKLFAFENKSFGGMKAANS